MSVSGEDTTGGQGGAAPRIQPSSVREAYDAVPIEIVPEVVDEAARRRASLAPSLSASHGDRKAIPAPPVSPAAPMSASHSAALPSAAPSTAWHQSVGGVLFFLFVALGPFAIPLLWKSPNFSRGSKVLLTLFVGGATVIVVVILLWMTALLTARLAELQQALQPR